MPASRTEIALDHSRWSGLVRRHAVLVVVVGLLGAGLGAAAAQALPAQFEAVADLRLAQDSGANNPQTSARAAANEMAALTSPQSVQSVVDAVGEQITLQAALLPDSDVARIEAVAGTAVAAEQAAGTLASTYVERRTADRQQQLEAARALITSSLAELNAAIGDTSDESQRALLAERTELRVRLAAIDEEQALSDADPFVISAPTSSQVPRPTATLGLVGLLLGLVLGAALAVLTDGLASRVRGRHDEVAPLVPTTVLDVAPEATSLTAEQHQQLDDSLRALAPRNGTAAAAAVVGATTTDPTSLVALRMAQSLNRHGYRPVLVDLDGAMSGTELTGLRRHPDSVSLLSDAADGWEKGAAEIDVVDLSGSSAVRQRSELATLRSDLDRHGVLLLVAGSSASVRSAPFDVAGRWPGVLVATSGRTRLRSARKAVDALGGVGLDVGRVVAVRSGGRRARRREARAATTSIP